MSAKKKLKRIQKLHSPIKVPKGLRRIGVGEDGTLVCRGCVCGDPFLDVPWPCETRQIADGTL